MCRVLQSKRNKRSHVRCNIKFINHHHLSHLVKVNHGFGMDANELQARPVALEELCKQAQEDGPHFFILERKDKQNRRRDM